jgi:hypothetical protein
VRSSGREKEPGFGLWWDVDRRDQAQVLDWRARIYKGEGSMRIRAPTPYCIPPLSYQSPHPGTGQGTESESHDG